MVIYGVMISYGMLLEYILFRVLFRVFFREFGWLFRVFKVVLELKYKHILTTLTGLAKGTVHIST